MSRQVGATAGTEAATTTGRDKRHTTDGPDIIAGRVLQEDKARNNALLHLPAEVHSSVAAHTHTHARTHTHADTRTPTPGFTQALLQIPTLRFSRFSRKRISSPAQVPRLGLRRENTGPWTPTSWRPGFSLPLVMQVCRKSNTPSFLPIIGML